jgi:bacillithiol biosynthesis cysteine-adding enzyme BshC
MKLRVEEQSMNQINPFGTAYIQDFASISSFFHYSPYEGESFKERLNDLDQRDFKRKELAQVIRQFQSKWGLSQKAEENLHKLEQPGSVVVIGGQQAGLLLGPLYSLHKVITILQLAKQKEEELNIPVVPVFWIAGEDHDFQEVNHVYTPRSTGTLMDKLTLTVKESQEVRNQESDKKSLSHRALPKQEVHEWLGHFFEHQPETEFTHEIKEELEHLIKDSDTYVDYFAQIMNSFFSKYGLLMIDSGNPELRKQQSDVFIKMIENYDLINQHVRDSMEQVKKQGFDPQIQVGNHPALLFIYEQGERLLLEKVGDDCFQTKDGKYSYSQEQLLQVAQKEPWLLSNNVITRPFMQESLFPTLAFVGGPGEISYWALYKSYFEQFNIKMPILAPRISVTLIEKPIANILTKRQIPLDVIFDHFDQFRQDWLKQQDEFELEESFAEVKGKIKDVYDPLMEKVKGIPGMEQLGEKNLTKILEQVEFLEKRSMASLTSQHEAGLRQFDKIEQALFPQKKLQERVYNPFTFINKHGMVLVDQLVELPLSANGKHKWIYI